MLASLTQTKLAHLLFLGHSLQNLAPQQIQIVTSMVLSEADIKRSCGPNRYAIRPSCEAIGPQTPHDGLATSIVTISFTGETPLTSIPSSPSTATKTLQGGQEALQMASFQQSARRTF